MDHALVMQILQALQDLGYVDSYQGLWEHAKPIGLDDGTEGAILHEFQDDVKVCPRLEGTHVLDNVLMVQGLEQLYLTHDTLQAARADALQRDLLDGNSVTTFQVNAFVHLPERTPA
jgi:hypothetical protein